jgi:hypothetical protein
MPAHDVSEVVAALLEGERLPRWVVADPVLISEISSGRRARRTTAGRVLEIAFGRLRFSIVGLCALRVLSFGIVFSWWVRARRRELANESVEAVFVGFGAATESTLVSRLIAECPGAEIKCVSARPDEWLAELARPALTDLLRGLWNSSGQLRRKITSVRTGLIAANEGRIAASVGRRIATYVYFVEWAKRLPVGIARIVCISLDAAIFGVVDGLEHRPDVSVEYWQHGFLNKSLVGPAGLALVRALNGPEARFLASRCPRARVEIESTQLRVPQLGMAPKRLLLVASQYDTADFRKAREVAGLQALMAWASSAEVEVAVRLHPREDERFWSRYFPDIAIDRGGGDFRACLDRLKPGIVCSWWSTALADALVAGVLPVLLSSTQPEALTALVFPLQDIALRFPEDTVRLDSALGSALDYRRLLDQKQLVIISASGPAAALADYSV